MSTEKSKTSLDENLLRDLVIHSVKEKYEKLYKEVHINPGREKNFEFKGLFPHVVFGGYGHITQIIEVETESDLNRDRAVHWEKLAGMGVPCTLLVPKKHQRTVADILWKTGLMAKVKVATYDMVFEKL